MKEAYAGQFIEGGRKVVKFPHAAGKFTKVSAPGRPGRCAGPLE